MINYDKLNELWPQIMSAVEYAADHNELDDEILTAVRKFAQEEGLNERI